MPSNNTTDSVFEEHSGSETMETPGLEDAQNMPKIFIESDAGDGTRREDQYLHGARLVLCFLSIFVCLFLMALDQTIIATLLTEVGNQFNAFDKVGWLASGFLLSMAVFIQPFGRLSIIFGRKIAMVTAVVLFEAGSLMSALAPNMSVLIGGRVLAGVGGAGIQCMAFVIVAEILPIERRPLGMAVMTCTFAVASVMGPLVGGLFTTHVSWRWCFYINLPIGGVALLLLLITFNPPRPKSGYIKGLKQFDYLGTFLFTAGTVVLLLAVTFGGSEYHWGSAPVILCFVLGGLTLIAFGIWNFRFSKNQIIPTDLVTIPSIVASVLTSSGIYAFFMVFMIYGAIYFQVIHDKSAISSGLHLLPSIISVVLISISSSIFIQRTKYIKPLTIVGGVLAPIGAGVACLLDVDSGFAKQVGYLIPGGLSAGLLMQASLISAQIKAPPKPGSTIIVTTLLNFTRSFITALAADLADAVYASSVNNLLAKAIKHETNQEILQELSTVNLKQIASNNTLIASLSPAAARFIKDVLMKSIRNVFYMGIGFASISTVSCLFITNMRLPGASTGAQEAEDEGQTQPQPESDHNSVDLDIPAETSSTDAEKPKPIENDIKENP